MAKKPETFNVSMDAKKNPGLRKQLGELRGGMVAAAERNKMPDRFLVVEHAHRPAVIIKDLETGRMTQIGLHGYGSVRKALGDLFGLPRPTPEQQFKEMRLPLRVEGDGFAAVGCRSPFEDDEVYYRIEIDGVDGGELGVAWIEIRDGGKKFAVFTQEGFITEEKKLQHAIQTVELDVMPDYRAAGPHP